MFGVISKLNILIINKQILQAIAEGLYGERKSPISNIQDGEIVQLCLEGSSSEIN